MAEDELLYSQDFICVKTDPLMNALPRLWELGYTLKIGPPEETLNATLYMLPGIREKLPHEGETVLVATKVRLGSDVGFELYRVLSEVGCDPAQIAHVANPGVDVVVGQLRDRVTGQAVLGRLVVSRDDGEHGWVKWALLLGLDPTALDFEVEDELPNT